MDPYVFDPLYSKAPPYTTLESPAFDEILDNLAVKIMNIPSSSANSPLGFENGSSTISNSLRTGISSPLMPSCYGNFDISSGYNFSPSKEYSPEQIYRNPSRKWNRRDEEEENGYVSAFEVPNIAEYGSVSSETRWSKFRVGGKVSGFPLTLPLSITSLSLSNNEISVIPDSIGKMQHLTYLNLSNNLLKNLPETLGELINLHTLILTNNLLESVPYAHCKLAALETYDLTGNPLNPQMSKFYKGSMNTADFITKLASFYVPEIPPPPAQRHWCFNKENTLLGVPVFDVMSYNILFQSYATPRQFHYCPTFALGWNYRLGKILNSIAEQSPQILALQEVGIDVFNKILLPMFEKQGYGGRFAPKSRYRSGPSSSSVDGSALFWKTDRFTYVQHEIVEFANAGAENAIGDCKENMLNRVMPYDNVALIVTLQPTQELLDSGEVKCKKMLPIVACSTHMFWNPDYCDVKLIQTMILLKAITRIARTIAGEGSIDDVPILIMGDFNSLPDSGVYKYLSSGHIERTHKEFKEFVFCDIHHLCEENYSDAYFYKHPLHLKSCIDASKFPFTNHTSTFTGMIDYIFVNSKTLSNVGYLHFDSDWVQTNNIVGFPNEHMPSDHIPIAARLGVIDRDSKNLVENILKKAISKNS